MTTLPLSLLTLVLSFAAPDAAPLPLPAPAPAPPPGPAAPVTVTWQQALDRAFARNPSAAVAMQEIARAEALVTQARAGWMPSLTGNGSYERIHSFNALPAGAPENIWGANLALSVPLVAPVAWANGAHARDNRAVAIASAADVHRQLAAAVGRAYLTVLLQHRQLEVARRARDTAQAHYDYAHTRMVSGLGNGIDDARAEQELRGDEAQLKNAETALVRAQSALAVLLSEESLVDVSEDLALGAPPAAAAAVADARERRADLQALRARQVAATHLKDDDWVFYAPSLLAQAAIFKQTPLPTQLGAGWTAAVVLSVPLFEGGLRSGIARERRAGEEEARATLDGMLRQVSVEVRAALEVVHNADDSLGSARAATKAANTAATLADKSYRAGASTNIEVIDAERAARDAASQAALAEDAARQARLDLLLATGAFP
jgi:outer membrane protein TolC